jgi:hypothetical protein
MRWIHSGMRRLLVLLLLASRAAAQITISDSQNLGVTLVGVAAGGGKVTAASATTNYELDPTTLVILRSYSNSGNVTDIGRTADGLKTIELHADNTFSIFRDTDRNLIYSGSVTANTSATWGISNSFFAGGNEYVQVGIVPSSGSFSYGIGQFNITTGSFSAGFNDFNGTVPNGLSTYLATDLSGDDPYNYRNLIGFTGSSPLVFDFGTYYYNSRVSTFLSGGSNIGLSDVATLNGNIYFAFSEGFVEKGSYELLSSTGQASAVPEPSSVALVLAVASLLGACTKRRTR